MGDNKDKATLICCDPKFIQGFRTLLSLKKLAYNISHVDGLDITNSQGSKLLIPMRCARKENKSYKFS
jgi:hypothetical protein